MMTGMATLFDPDGPTTGPERKVRAPIPEGAKPRVHRPDRLQVQLRAVHLDGLIPEEHTARAVWTYVEGLDLEQSPLYERIRAIEGGSGRTPIDPRILLALWLYATLDGVGSARKIERLCDDHVVYQWICGGVSVNYHTLADFRVREVETLDRLLTHSVAVLRTEGLVGLKRVAQDGMRVRASAGSGSFRRESKLKAHLEDAERLVAKLRRELDSDPSAPTRREAAARKRAAENRVRRIEEALKTLPKIEKREEKAARAKKSTSNKKTRAAEKARAAKQARAEEKARADAAARAKDQPPADGGALAGGATGGAGTGSAEPAKGEPRASTTDPEARVMKMADGGFRPAFNVQFAADTESQIIVGVSVGNVGSDRSQLTPMLEQLASRFGTTPSELLADGGFLKFEELERASVIAPDCSAFIPPMKNAAAPKASDSPAVTAWRERMASPESKPIYKLRASTIECVNALARNRGLQRFLVRGLQKVRAVALLFALAHNLARSVSLRLALATA